MPSSTPVTTHVRHHKLCTVTTYLQDSFALDVEVPTEFYWLNIEEPNDTPYAWLCLRSILGLQLKFNREAECKISLSPEEQLTMATTILSCANTLLNDLNKLLKVATR